MLSARDRITQCFALTNNPQRKYEPNEINHSTGITVPNELVDMQSTSQNIDNYSNNSLFGD